MIEIISKLKDFIDKLSNDYNKETEWIPYIKAGSNIKGKEYTADYLMKLASNYDPTIIRSPVMIGHTSDGINPLELKRLSDKFPAHGYVSQVKFDEDRLWLKLSGLSDSLKSDIINNRFNGFSAEIASTHSDSSIPMPYLAGFAMLGATIPAVSGSFIDESKLSDTTTMKDIDIIYLSNEDEKDTNQNVKTNSIEEGIMPEENKDIKAEEPKSAENPVTKEKVITTETTESPKAVEIDTEKQALIEEIAALKDVIAKQAVQTRFNRFSNEIPETFPPAIKETLLSIATVMSETEDVIKMSDGKTVDRLETFSNIIKNFNVGINKIPDIYNNETKETDLDRSVNKLIGRGK